MNKTLEQIKKNKPEPTEYWWISHSLDPGRPMLVQVTTEGEELRIISPGNEIKGPVDLVDYWIEKVKPNYNLYNAIKPDQKDN